MRSIKSILFTLLILNVLNHEINSQTYLEKDLKNLIRENCQYNINNYILDKVNKNRIVMIADEGHGNHIYLQTVVDFLNYWIDSIKVNKEQNITRSLYLVLECDSNHINSIYKYFSVNNPFYLLDPTFITGYQYTSAVIEFYDDLKQIHQKAASINKGLSEDNKISFKLFGPEGIIDLNNWSVEKREKYFISERDEYSSGQIISLLEKDTASKAIIYYGAAHLIPFKTRKSQNSKEEGYYIGYYLSKHFKTNGGYFSIDQISASQNYWLNDCYKCSEQNYVIENSIFEGQAIPGNMQPQFADASIVLFNKNIKQPHISQMWSRNMIDCFINNAFKYTNLKSEFNRGIITSGINYLSSISGGEMDNFNYNDSAAVSMVISKWTNWRDKLQMNIAEEIIKQNIIRNKIKVYEISEYPVASRYEYEFGNMIGAKVWYSQGNSPSERAKGYYNFIEKYSKPIIAENLINLLWIGTHEEKNTALEYLKSAFSQDLNTAKEWTEWWRRSEYCN